MQFSSRYGLPDFSHKQCLVRHGRVASLLHYSCSHVASCCVVLLKRS